ncbi:ACP5 [Mytilus coruscus]|uniref:Tartrate-resistant acid phosphatase type 5 n=1 Tax=Mytilus coruscus TaxID=42192 RepID=A0A6J8D1S6_MYTCO|nr:ACP5 [Mytilus coruscus]
MGALTSTYGTQFNLALGDNFYFDGVKTVSDARFKETFDKVFTDPSLQKTPFYLVAGNHDHNGNVSAQIAYSKVEDRWNFPDYYYKLNFPIPGSQMSVDIIMIDTILLCGNSDHDFLGKQPKGPANQKVADDQLTWIEKQIQTSNASYLLVAGHYPVYSIAEHGPTDCLINILSVPLTFWLLDTTHASYLLVAGHYPVYSIAEHGPTDCLINILSVPLTFWLLDTVLAEAWNTYKYPFSASYLLVAGHYPVYSIAEHGPTDCLINILSCLLGCWTFSIVAGHYLLVAGHYPVYSIAEHGPTDCLIDKLLPTLQKYKITAYLSGHDHNLQHLLVTRPGLKMNFFVSGGANFADKSNKHKNKVPDKSSKFFWAEESQHGGFAYVEALTTNMTWTFVNGESKNLYQYVLYPRS